MWLALQSQMVQSHEDDDLQLSQEGFDEILVSLQEPPVNCPLISL